MFEKENISLLIALVALIFNLLVITIVAPISNYTYKQSLAWFSFVLFGLFITGVVLVSVL